MKSMQLLLPCDLDTWSSPTPGQRLLRNITVSDTFDISVQLCVPPNGMKNIHLQIASHGFAFDKRYWDAAVNPSEYSYVDATLAAGYSILTYDRLGTGLSDKPDGDTIVQAPLELEILPGFTQMARSGDLLKHAVGTENGTVPETTSNHSIVAFDKSSTSATAMAISSPPPSSPLTATSPMPPFSRAMI